MPMFGLADVNSFFLRQLRIAVSTRFARQAGGGTQ